MRHQLALEFYPPVPGLSGLPGEVAAAVAAHESEFRELFRLGGSAAESAEGGAGRRILRPPPRARRVFPVALRVDRQL